MGRGKHYLPVPVIDDAGLSRQVRRQERGKKTGERLQLMRLRQDRLKPGLGPQDPVELGQRHGRLSGKGQGRKKSCRLS